MLLFHILLLKMLYNSTHITAYVYHHLFLFVESLMYEKKHASRICIIYNFLCDQNHSRICKMTELSRIIRRTSSIMRGSIIVSSRGSIIANGK